MRVGEYGNIIRVNAAYDMSAWTGLALTFTRPDGTILTKTNPAVIVGSVDVVTPIGTFLAHQYVEYAFIAGDLTQSQNWYVQLAYTDSSKRLISPTATFFVDP